MLYSSYKRKSDGKVSSSVDKNMYLPLEGRSYAQISASTTLLMYVRMFQYNDPKS